MAGFGRQDLFAALVIGLVVYGASAAIRSLTIIAKSTQKPTAGPADRRREDDRA